VSGRNSQIPARIGRADAEDRASPEYPWGRKLYLLRKQTPESAFSIMKSVMGYRQCLLRGLENVRGEWNLVNMSWNIKRTFAMQPLLGGHRDYSIHHFQSTSK